MSVGNYSNKACSPIMKGIVGMIHSLEKWANFCGLIELKYEKKTLVGDQ